LPRPTKRLDSGVTTGRMGAHSIVSAAAALGGRNVVGAVAGTLAGDFAGASVGQWAGDTLGGTLLANVAAGAAGAATGGAIGGGAGAISGAGGALSADLFNRQLPDEEKRIAKHLAEKSAGKYTREQIEEQMRGMGVAVNGEHESGAPATLIGETPTDPGAQWISGGMTSDGKPILTQVTAQADPELQAFISTYAGSASPGQVPTGYRYDAPAGNGLALTLPQLTGPFTRFNSHDVEFVRNTTADTAAMVSKNAGRFSAAAAAASAIPSPYAPGYAAAAYGATVVGITADAIAQMVRPNVGQYTYEGVLSMGSQIAGDRFPLASPVINEAAESLKGSSFSRNIHYWINQQWDSIVNPNGQNK